MDIAVIGMGAMGRTHYAMLKEHVGINAKILCDTNQAQLEGLEAEIKTTNVSEAIDQADVVMVATPTHLHAGIVLEALTKGKTVFCQKPLARTLDEAKQILEAVRSNGKPFQVGYIMRYSSVWNKVKEMMEKIGSPIFWREIWHINGQSYPPWLSGSEGGGVLFEDSHRLEFLCHALGKPIAVMGFVDSFTPKYHDTMGVMIKFQNGTAMWSDSWARTAPGQSNRKPRIVFDAIGHEGHIVHPVRENETILYDLNGNEQETITWDHLGISGYEVEMKSFMNHVNGAPLEGCSIEEAVQVIALIDAIEKASIQGGIIPVEQF